MHSIYMKLALELAKNAYLKQEVPIGAVLVREGEVLGRGYNQVEGLQDATAHAEILAIKAAAGSTQNWRLTGTKLYTTLEPCPMCWGAIMLSRIDEVYFAAKDPRLGVAVSTLNLLEEFGKSNTPLPSSPRFIHLVEYEAEAQKLIKDFFVTLRNL